MELRVVQEILEELLPSLETLEAQSGAMLQFLKEKGIANDEQLAPHLEQARSASNIRWRAARLRINRLLVSTIEKAEKNGETKSQESAPELEGESGQAPQEQATGTQPEKSEKDSEEVSKRPTRTITVKQASQSGRRDRRRT